MKLLIIPHWMNATFSKNGISLTKAMHYPTLEKFFSKKDIEIYETLNSFCLSDIINPYLGIASFGGKMPNTDKVFQRVELDFTVLKDENIDIFSDSKMRDVAIKTQTSLLGRTLPESMCVSFKCIELAFEQCNEPVAVLIPKIIPKEADSKIIVRRTANEIFDVLVRHGETLKQITEAGITGLLITNL